MQGTLSPYLTGSHGSCFSLSPVFQQLFLKFPFPAPSLHKTTTLELFRALTWTHFSLNTPIHPISATYKDKTLVFITPVFFLHSKCKFIIPCLSSTWNSHESHTKIFKMEILIFTPCSTLPISSLVQCDTLGCLRQKQRFYLALSDTSLSYAPSNS